MYGTEPGSNGDQLWRPQDPASDRLQVPLVGVFQNQDPARSEHAAQFGEHRGRVREMVEDSDADSGVEVAVGVGQGESVAQDDVAARVAAGPFQGRTDVDLRRVEQDDFAVAAVFVRQPPEAGADLDKAVTLRREQGPERDSVAGVLVPAGSPEDVAVAEILVCGEGARRESRVRTAQISQEGLVAPTARLWMAKSSALPDQPQSHRTMLVRALYSSIRWDFTGRSGAGATRRADRPSHCASSNLPSVSTLPTRRSRAATTGRRIRGRPNTTTPFLGAHPFYQKKPRPPIRRSSMPDPEPGHGGRYFRPPDRPV